MRDETFNLNMCVVFIRFMATSISNCAARVYYYVTVSAHDDAIDGVEDKNKWFARLSNEFISTVLAMAMSFRLFKFNELNAWNMLDEFRRIMCCSD